MKMGIANSRAVLAKLLVLSLAGLVGNLARARAAGERIAVLEQQLAAMQDRLRADATERSALAAAVVSASDDDSDAPDFDAAARREIYRSSTSLGSASSERR